MKINPMTRLRTLTALVPMCAALAAPAALPDRIDCEGEYPGHLQGVATDGESIYWSFTIDIVKTDLSGKILALRKTPPCHHGDLCWKDGVVYVAVNRGRFNTESRAVSEVTAFDAKTLMPIKTWSIPDVPHGAGGITWKGDSFYVIGGLPLMHEKNYVYEYDKNFKLVKRHDLDTGFTWMGIQTAAHEDSTFYFGIYGHHGDPQGTLACPDSLASFSRYTGDGCVGILKLDGAYYLAKTPRSKENKKRFTGYIVRQKAFPDSARLYEVKRTGKGELRIFFEGRDKTGWKDVGYVFDNEKNSPVFSWDSLFVAANKATTLAELPSVCIGGGRAWWTPDLVRGVRRAAERDEVFSIRLPGTPETLKDDASLAAAIDSLEREACRLGVKVTGRKK